MILLRYLNKYVGLAHNITFVMRYMPYDDLKRAMDEGTVDMVYLDASDFACCKRRINLQPIANVCTRTKLGDKFFDNCHYHGAFVVRNNSSITRVEGVLPGYPRSMKWHPGDAHGRTTLSSIRA